MTVGAAIGVLVREFWTVPATVRKHDERVRNRDEDLRSWVQDDDNELGAELQHARALLATPGVESLVRGRRLRVTGRTLKDQRLHRYRDQLRDAERIRREVIATENVVHRAWRRTRRRPVPVLTSPDQVAPVLARWEADDPPGFWDQLAA